MVKYSDKLKDPRWQKKRLEILERDEWVCQKCFDGETALSVHHLCYERNKDPWEYSNDDLLTLCENCHHQEFKERPILEKKLLKILKKKGFLYDDVNRIIKAFEKLSIYHSPDVTASIIEAILSKENFLSFGEQYFTNLRTKLKDKPCQDHE